MYLNSYYINQKYHIPQLLLQTLYQYINASIEQDIMKVLQLLFEVYRPVLVYSPSYTLDASYIYSYTIDMMVFFITYYH